MILDSISALNLYLKIHPAILTVCNFIESTDLCRLPAGRKEIIEGKLFATKGVSAPKGDDALLEVHRKFIDIQCVLDGVDRIGWSPLACCKNPLGEFNCEKDVWLFSDTPNTWLNIYPSMFAIFLPTDAHAPLGGTESVNKIIFKVAVEW